MATVLFNGLFNTLALGIPIWGWVLLVLGLVMVISNAYWYFMFWNPLRPLHGLWKANWAKIDATLLSDLDINLKLVSEARAKVIFDESIDDAKQGETDWQDITSGQIGTTGTDIILDLGKWTKEGSEEKHIIADVADKWNMNHPEDQIHSFSKFIKYSEEGKLEAGISTLMVINWIRIESAFPKKRNKAAYAGYIRQLAEKLDKEERSKFTDIAIYMLAGAVIISVLMILGKFLLHKP